MKKIRSVKQLLITLVIGFVPIAICFTLGWPIAGWIFVLLTLFALCFAFTPPMYTAVFSLWSIAVLGFITTLLVDRLLFAGVGLLAGWRPILVALIGLSVGTAIVSGFWTIVFYVNARWLMDSSRSLGVSTQQMMNFVFSRVFQIGQQVLIVDDGPNGVQVTDTTRGILSSVGGPGILILAPGFAAILQSGGRITRVVGPGIHRLNKFENFVQPRDTKGIVDLRPQFAPGLAEDVRTKDGIPLKIQVGTFFQLEPTYITDRRPESHYEGGDATTKVIGGPEYPVYEAIIRKSLTKIPRGGFKTGWFPSDPITRLRDVVATYTLDEIFQVVEDNPSHPRAAPDRRVIKKIEEEINRQFDPSGGGVWFKGLDIREIKMPDDVEARMIKDWTEAKALRMRIAEAETNRQTMIVESEGRALALERMERARAKALEAASEMMIKLMETLKKAGHEKEAWNFVNVVRQLTIWAGHDDKVAMNYIEAMQRIVESDGAKHIFIQPTGFLTNPLIEAQVIEKPGTPKMVSGGHTINGEPLIQDEDAG